jgi:arylsulfatase A-like enzyme
VRDIVDALERTGRLSNTVLMFTSDNGLAMGEHRWVAKKDCVYEECIKVPLLVRAPGVAPRDDAHLISNLDLTATIMDYAGAPAPHPLNGLSLRPLLANPSAPWRDALLTEVLGESPQRNEQSVRTDRYVYAEYQNGDRELYDLEADPFELENKVNDPSYTSVVTDLQSRLEALRTE